MTTKIAQNVQDTKIDVLYEYSRNRVCKIPGTNIYVLREEDKNDVCINGKEVFLKVLQGMGEKGGFTIDPNKKGRDGNGLFCDVSYRTRTSKFYADGKSYNDREFTNFLVELGLF